MFKRFFISIAKVSLLFILAIFYASCSPTKPDSSIESFYNYPNPFDNRSTSTMFRVSIKDGSVITSAKLYIYSKTGDLLDMKDFIVTEGNAKEAMVAWAGLDKNGKYLPRAVYIAKVVVKDNRDATYTSEFNTLIN